jgi:hypothetical protein
LTSTRRFSQQDDAARVSAAREANPALGLIIRALVVNVVRPTVIHTPEVHRAA